MTTIEEKKEFVNKRLKEIECDGYKRELKKEIDFLKGLFVNGTLINYQKIRIENRIKELEKIIK